MKAVIQDEYGAPNVLQIKEIEKPKPAANELLIKIFATTVNRSDCANHRADLFITRLLFGLSKPRKQTTGTDFAGIVEEVGAGVDKFKKGDRVFGFDDTGLESHAEYLVISENKAISLMPADVSFEEAAACIEGFHYALNCINKINLQKGDKVLVNGATGAIGSATVQLLKYYGAEITAVCRANDFDLVKSLGAHQLLDYENEDFTQLKQQYDYIIDAVGKSSFSRCKPILSEKGVYISSELGENNENITLSFISLFKKGKIVKFPFPSKIDVSLSFLSQLMEEGKYKAIIDRIYSLRDVVEAFEFVESGNKVGSVILQIHKE